jgi:L-ascorbate metabolism protein UlaG (beta-lactamase superfamily)
MKIHQLRNATIVLEYSDATILVDPMLAARGTLPPLRLGGGRVRNPLVDLPAGSHALLDQVTHGLITHCQKGHFDHLDRAGARWLRERQVPVTCTPHDARYLASRGVNVAPLPEGHEQPSPFLGGTIRTQRCVHGHGLVGRLMEHGVGYLIERPGEPSVYVAGDTLFTPAIRDFVLRHQPDVCVVPAGGARFDLGGHIIMGIDEVIALATTVSGQVVANHLEALSHCPTTRAGLRAAARSAGIADRLVVPEDGDSICFEVRSGRVSQDAAGAGDV